VAPRTGGTALLLKKDKILVAMEIKPKLLLILLVTEDWSDVSGFQYLITLLHETESPW
jgi:hypothetical protein